MDMNQAAQLLHRAYHNALNRKKMAGLHLFGMKYASELEDLEEVSASSRNDLHKMLVSLAKVPDPHRTEINKGINLAEHAEVKTDSLWF